MISEEIKQGARENRCDFFLREGERDSISGYLKVVLVYALCMSAGKIRTSIPCMYVNFVCQ